MEIQLSDLGIEAPDLVAAGRVAIRLTAAVVLGGLIGWERERRGRAAGFRTHMLIALGAALFTAVPTLVETDDYGRVYSELVRGIAAGVGFLGAGAILKLSGERQIKGLTTAAGVWTTAAIGFAAGAGWITVAMVATGLTWFILKILTRIDDSLQSGDVRDAG